MVVLSNLNVRNRPAPWLILKRSLEYTPIFTVGFHLFVLKSYLATSCFCSPSTVCMYLLLTASLSYWTTVIDDKALVISRCSLCVNYVISLGLFFSKYYDMYVDV